MIVYADKFSNKANTVHGMYMPLHPSRDPEADYKTGSQTGTQPLSANMKLHVNPNATGIYIILCVRGSHVPEARPR